MKIAEAMKTIDEKWVEKKKGFRVCMERYDGNSWVQELSPGENATPLDSDVTSWRLAWKLAQSTPIDHQGPGQGDLVNIFVVDEEKTPIPYYVTGEREIFNVFSTKS